MDNFKDAKLMLKSSVDMYSSDVRLRRRPSWNQQGARAKHSVQRVAEGDCSSIGGSNGVVVWRRVEARQPAAAGWKVKCRQLTVRPQRQWCS